MAKLFGTDGARGVANKELNSIIAYRIGQAAVKFLGRTIVVGKDTRLSGDMLENALEAGIMSMGGTALSVGIIPTPAIALLTRELHADAGAVISASHNPPEYNGIKFFDANGFKLPVALEEEIEAYVIAGGEPPEKLPNGDAVGFVLPVDDAAEIYIDHAVNAVRSQGVDFTGWKIALDTGHGAASVTSEEAFRRLGAEVVTINDEWDGTDINVGCGSTNLGPTKQLVAECGATIGVAHDGDADRVMLVDSLGNEMDGDVVEAVCAIDMKKRGCLPHDTVVSTVMCNLGFRQAMAAQGIEVERTSVGDRHVLERMREGGFAIGGEQSGHMIFLDYNSTGDGLMTACLFIAACIRNGWTPEEAGRMMTHCPQVLLNVKVTDKHAFEWNKEIAAAVREAEAEMGDDGQILVRASGTEPLIRVMVEASDEDRANEVAERIAAVVREELA
ncbi:MAG: phosphoglucosamine mutase [Coriobacteriia bacterium]|nr:phosphoglucosamine mutase [Coriobacteriia bacterium]